ncbi:MAG: C-terminal binding protein [Selenomonadaceae bacterium]
MSELKVYITDYEYASLQEEEKELEKADLKLIPKQCKSENDVIKQCNDAVGLLNQYAPITRKVIEALPNLKVVARYGVGVNTIDLDAATEHGVCVLNVPDYCMDEVSNQAFLLMLACQRKLIMLNDQVQNGSWDYKISKPIYRLAGQTMGLLGFGRIPRILAEKARAFGIKILIYDPYLRQSDVDSFGATLLPLQEVLKKADMLSVHVPLTKDTYHLIGEKEFALMKKHAVIVNTSRGQLIDEEALYKALKSKQLAGAGLDVMTNEPIEKESKLLGLPNVIITPHVAWYSEEAEKELKRKAAHGVVTILSGYDTENIVNYDIRKKLSLKKKTERGFFDVGCNH